MHDIKSLDRTNLCKNMVRILSLIFWFSSILRCWTILTLVLPILYSMFLSTTRCPTKNNRKFGTVYLIIAISVTIISNKSKRQDLSSLKQSKTQLLNVISKLKTFVVIFLSRSWILFLKVNNPLTLEIAASWNNK